jgi:DnaJ-class molecular chaperone
MYKPKAWGERYLLDTEVICLRCEGCGLINNKVCKSCNGHGVLARHSQNGFFHMTAYSPDKRQKNAQEKLGGVA